MEEPNYRMFPYLYDDYVIINIALKGTTICRNHIFSVMLLKHRIKLIFFTVECFSSHKF